MEFFEDTADVSVKLIVRSKRGDNKRLMCGEETGEGQLVDGDVSDHARSMLNALMNKDRIPG